MPIGPGLQEKLRKIEALYAGAGTPGERDAAEAALDKELRRYLNSVTSKLIKDEVYADTSEAAEVDVARLSAG